MKYEKQKQTNLQVGDDKLVKLFTSFNTDVAKCGSSVDIWFYAHALKLFYSEKLSESLTGIEPRNLLIVGEML